MSLPACMCVFVCVCVQSCELALFYYYYELTHSIALPPSASQLRLTGRQAGGALTPQLADPLTKLLWRMRMRNVALGSCRVRSRAHRELLCCFVHGLCNRQQRWQRAETVAALQLRKLQLLRLLLRLLCSLVVVVAVAAVAVVIIIIILFDGCSCCCCAKSANHMQFYTACCFCFFISLSFFSSHMSLHINFRCTFVPAFAIKKNILILTSGYCCTQQGEGGGGCALQRQRQQKSRRHAK